MRYWRVVMVLLPSLVGWGQRVMSPEELRQKAQECVRAQLGAIPFEIQWIGEGRTVRLPQGAEELRCVSDSSALQQGRFLFEAWGGGRYLGRFLICGNVWVVAPEARLRQQVEAGESVTVDRVELITRRMSLAEYWKRVTPEEIGTLRARRRLPSGSPMLRSDWIAQSGVRRGERVRLIARVGAVEVRTAAQALEDGEPGQQIRVLHERAQRVLRARVLDATTVEVVPSGE